MSDTLGVHGGGVVAVTAVPAVGHLWSVTWQRQTFVTLCKHLIVKYRLQLITVLPLLSQLSDTFDASKGRHDHTGLILLAPPVCQMPIRITGSYSEVPIWVLPERKPSRSLLLVVYPSSPRHIEQLRSARRGYHHPLDLLARMADWGHLRRC